LGETAVILFDSFRTRYPGTGTAVNTDNRPATIRDVAAEANVSTSTVSLYMRGRDGVSEETGLRIAAAIEKLSYVPRRRTVHDQQHAFLGLLIEELPLLASSDIIYHRIIHAIEAQAKQHHYGMLFSITEKERLPRMVSENQVRGLIILGGSPVNDALAMDLARREIPLVLVDNYIFGLNVDSVVPDNEEGGYLAFRHLVELGHERIATIEGPPKYRTLTDRLNGALRAAAELGFTLRPEYRQPSLSGGRPKKGYLEMQQLLALPERPTAVYTVSDKTAFGALEAIKDAGLRVPDDISLVGFDDVADSAHTVPPLTTVHVPKYEMGVLAMQRLFTLIETGKRTPLRIRVPTSLTVRRSTTTC
jgi:DNA-binding LacI/PurR family transcriptional regulator